MIKWQKEEIEICKSWLITTELYSQLIVLLKYKKTESAVYKYHDASFISYLLLLKKILGWLIVKVKKQIFS